MIGSFAKGGTLPFRYPHLALLSPGCPVVPAAALPRLDVRIVIHGKEP